MVPAVFAIEAMQCAPCYIDSQLKKLKLYCQCGTCGGHCMGYDEAVSTGMIFGTCVPGESLMLLLRLINNVHEDFLSISSLYRRLCYTRRSFHLHCLVVSDALLPLLPPPVRFHCFLNLFVSRHPFKKKRINICMQKEGGRR